MPFMKGRTGFILGVAAGYVLGARAGRDRYEQIKNATAKIAEQEQIQVAIEATAEPRSTAQRLMGKSLRAASRTLRSGS
jgi:hypothetical protein